MQPHDSTDFTQTIQSKILEAVVTDCLQKGLPWVMATDWTDVFLPRATLAGFFGLADDTLKTYLSQAAAAGWTYRRQGGCPKFYALSDATKALHHAKKTEADAE